MDAYGNVIQVTEPNPAGGTFTTNYTYTPFNQLAGVSMTRGNVTQTRTFLYTGSDLTSATNPENGTFTYVTTTPTTSPAAPTRSGRRRCTPTIPTAA